MMSCRKSGASIRIPCAPRKEFPLDRWEEIRENAQFHTRRSIGIMLFRIIEHQIHHRAQVGTYLRILTGGRASPYEIEIAILLPLERKPACHYDVTQPSEWR